MEYNLSVYISVVKDLTNSKTNDLTFELHLLIGPAKFFSSLFDGREPSPLPKEKGGGGGVSKLPVHSDC